MRSPTLKVSLLSTSLVLLVLLCATGVIQVQGLGERCDDDFGCKGKACCIVGSDTVPVEFWKTCRPYKGPGIEGPYCSRPKRCRQNYHCGVGEVCVGCPCTEKASGLCGVHFNDWADSDLETDSFMSGSGSGSGFGSESVTSGSGAGSGVGILLMDQED